MWDGWAMSDHGIEMTGKKKAVWRRESVCATWEAAKRVRIKDKKSLKLKKR